MIRPVILLISIIPSLISLDLQAEVEITPFTGYRLSGEFTDITTGTTLEVDDDSTLGFALEVDHDRNTQTQLLYSRQSSALRASSNLASNLLFDIDVEYIHFGGIVLTPINKNMNSFAGAGIGITRFSPNFSGHTSESEFSFNLNGGFKQQLSKHLGIRAGLIFYATPVNSNSAIFCTNGSCNIHFNSNLYTQFEANIGLVIKF